MKRFAVLALVSVLVALATSSTAGARGTALTPAEISLQKQINALQKTTKTLKADIAKIKKSDDALFQDILFVFVANECTNAITADALQGTWAIIDQISTATQAGKTYFGTQTPVDDRGICAALQVTRSQVSPPSIGSYTSLLGLLPSSAALAKGFVL